MATHDYYFSIERTHYVGSALVKFNKRCMPGTQSNAQILKRYAKPEMEDL